MAEKNKDVVATVAGKEITQRDVVDYISTMDPNLQAQFSTEEGMIQVRDELVRQELLYLDAMDKKFYEEEEFKAVFEQAKINMLKSYAFAKTIEGIHASEEEAHEFYEQVKPNLKQPEGVHAGHILVSEEDKAKELKKELDEGADFEALAREHSTCPSKEKGGDLGTFQRGQMVEPFDKKVFSMEEDEISDPVKTEFGYHIIKLYEKVPERIPEFDEIREDIKMEVLRQKQQKSYLSKIQSLMKEYPVELKK